MRLLRVEPHLQPHTGAAMRRDEVIDEVEARLAIGMEVDRSDVGERDELEARAPCKRAAGGHAGARAAPRSSA